MTTTTITTLADPTAAPPPGVYRDVPAAAYHAWPMPSSTVLGRLARSPLHCRHALDHPQPSTPDMEFGTAFHARLLEPDRFGERYAAAGPCVAVLKTGRRLGQPCGADGVGRGPAGGWLCGTHGGGTDRPAGDARAVLGTADAAALDAMAAAVAAHGWASQTLALPGETELSVVFDEPASGVRCKVRPDRVVTDPRRACVVDVKTTRDAAPEAFARTIAQRGYHRQAALYLRGLAAHGIDVGGFTILAVDKDDPYAVAAYRLDDADLAAGGREVDRLLAAWAECDRTGSWPGYGGGGLVPIRLPAWARDRAGGDDDLESAVGV